MSDDATKIAIACQGGGRHTAFTAGALQRLLPEITRSEYDLVGFSGTSGGSVCALLAWYGHVNPELAPSALLGEFWNDLKASTPSERYVNDIIVKLSKLRAMGVGVPKYSPSQTPAGMMAR